MTKLRIREANNSDKISVLKFCKNTFSWGDYVEQVWNFWISEGHLFLGQKPEPAGICHAFYSDNQVWIEGIRIESTFRRQNIASELVKHAEIIGLAKNLSFSYMLIDAILDALKMRKPIQGFFSRLEFKGMPISKRIIKPLIEEGKVTWYDDPRLPTLEALKRRGIKPEAIRKFIMSLGLTKANTLAPFDALEAFNRKFVDADSIRLFMVSNAKKLTIKNLSTSSIEIPNHPINDMGKRVIEIDENFYISGDDAQSIKEGTQIRLLGLGNVVITKQGIELEGEFVENGERKDIPKIQWVPQKTAHKIKMIIPKALFIGDEFNEDSLEELDVFTEPHYLQLKEGEEIQFVRFGYCRKDSQNQAIFTHK